MPSLEDFIKSLTQEKTKLINMGAIKGPRAHAVTVHDGSHKYQKSKQRIPFKICMHEKTNRSDVSDTSEKQPWRSHPRGCKEEEARRCEFQERQF
jgi:hypothetical protein